VRLIRVQQTYHRHQMFGRFKLLTDQNLHLSNDSASNTEETPFSCFLHCLASSKKFLGHPTFVEQIGTK